MRKTLSAFAVFVTFCARAQNDSSEIEMNSVAIVMVKLPASTAIGDADGKLISKEIGSPGGNIISDDGRVELIFPQGALSANTSISIQPIVNLVPNGDGKAYKFEPSGIQFKKPVQVIFHYTDQEAGICPPQLKFMAVQDRDGKWEYMNYDEWDSAGKTLKGSISHFSAFVDGRLMDLSPNEKTLKVGQSFSLSLDVVQGPGEDELPPLPVAKRKIKWSVQGGTRAGTLTVDAGKYSATYKAPQYLSKNDPKVILKIDELTIHEVVQRTKHKKGLWTGTTRVPEIKNLATFTCNINLYDEYRISVIYQGPCGLRCGPQLMIVPIFRPGCIPTKLRSLM